jgi:glycine cleavage system transcriptional repressor
MVTILGQDRPGIVYAVSRAIRDLDCDIEEVSQTILQNEFAGLFIVSRPPSVDQEALGQCLTDALAVMGMSVTVKDFEAGPPPTPIDTEPFVITLRGEDRRGLIPDLTGVIAGFEVNIENLKAIKQDGSDGVVIAFEVAVPPAVHLGAFREGLELKADELGLQISVQHRDIFEAIHRI